MSGLSDRNEHTVSNRTMELVVAGAFLALSLLVMYDNWRTGARWVEDGPQAGYFPFYIGLIMFIASGATFVSALRAGTDHTNFVERGQLKQVFQVFIPTVAFVGLIWFLGIYVSTVVFITFFMTWLGKYPIYKSLAVAVAVPVFLFVMFEIWFLVPLPKGPLETALGY
jgi:hypothetical protein